MSLPSHEDPNLAKIVTMWQDEESLLASEKPLFDEAINKVKEFLKSSPITENYKMFSPVFPAEEEAKGVEEDFTEKFVCLKR